MSIIPAFMRLSQEDLEFSHQSGLPGEISEASQCNPTSTWQPRNSSWTQTKEWSRNHPWWNHVRECFKGLSHLSRKRRTLIFLTLNPILDWTELTENCKSWSRGELPISPNHNIDTVECGFLCVAEGCTWSEFSCPPHSVGTHRAPSDLTWRNKECPTNQQFTPKKSRNVQVPDIFPQIHQLSNFLPKEAWEGRQDQQDPPIAHIAWTKTLGKGFPSNTSFWFCLSGAETLMWIIENVLDTRGFSSLLFVCFGRCLILGHSDLELTL